jgi:5'-3' exonuclease
MSNRLLIVDGDLVAYRHAAAAESRTIIAKHLKSSREKEFKTRTEMKKFLSDKNIEFKPEDYEITDHQHPVDISFAISTVNASIEKLLENTWCDELEIYIGSGKTFRHSLPLPSPYKDNREDMLKPVHLTAVRNHLKRKYKAKVVENGLEVDDVVTIRSYECLQNDQEAVLASVDKDSYQCQGISLYNWLAEEPKIELIPDLGHLRKVKSAVKGDGLMFLALQVLAGDSADTYKGYELSKVSYGPAKAMKALQDCTSEQQILRVLISEFKRLYPETFSYTDCHGVEHEEADWFDMLQLYWTCAYMKRSWDDVSSFMQFAMERGVNPYE